MNLFIGKTLRRTTAALAAAALAAVSLATVPAATASTAAEDDYEVLVVGKTLGFRHSHIVHTTQAIIELGEDNGFTVDVWDPPNDSGGWWGPGSPGQPELTLESTPFTSAEDLSRYATIVFVSPVDNTNDLDPAKPRLLDDAELAAFQGYIRAGGGFTGIHAATDTMHTVPWYGQLTGGGARFISHPAQQTATMRVESPTHPSTEFLPAVWERFDEWYNYTANPRADVHVLLTLDESTYDPGNNAMGEDHPIAWCHNFEGGRSWYEGAGHTDASYSDPIFREHVLAGIQWTAGVVEGGGNCVTFREVDEILDGLDTSAAIDGILAGAVADLLDVAENAADAGDHDAAIDALGVASALVTHLSDAAGDRELLATKIVDLTDWQTGLRDFHAAPPLAFDVEVQPRCVAGRVALAVRAVNENAFPADVSLQTPYGTRTVADVAPGAVAYQSFASRSASVEAGSVTITGTATVDDQEVQEALQHEYAAHSCD